MKNQKGQLLLILILVMAVALSIGLSVVQKSLVDVSTSSKVEQSSRAFSAAEAGIEKALRNDPSVQSLDNNSSITAIVDNLIPRLATNNTRQDALEMPPIAKEDPAQIWLANFRDTANPPSPFYAQQTLDVYWGNPEDSNKAAIEITLVYYDDAAAKYQSRKWYLDHNPPRGSGFRGVPCAGNYTLSVKYSCYVRLGYSGNPVASGNPIVDPFYSDLGYGDLPTSPNRQMLLRIRLLYNTNSQPFAVRAVGTCGRPCSLPAQARSIISTGVSGETQRKINLFQSLKKVLPFFDYAIFSAGEITKR